MISRILITNLRAFKKQLSIYDHDLKEYYYKNRSAIDLKRVSLMLKTPMVRLKHMNN